MPRRRSSAPILTTVRSSFTRVLDALFLGEQYLPGLAVAVRPKRANPVHQLGDQLIGELTLVTVAVEPGLDRGGDVAPDGIAVDAASVCDRALAVAFQPAPQRL
jgi:hypothetical protein